MALVRWVGGAIGLDVHCDFCVVAICEDGKVRSAGRVASTPDGLGALAESLLATDRVALEVTGSWWEVARILEAHVQRVVVVSLDDTGISSARAKTDKLDSRTLASLLWKGELDAVWMPDERCRVLRRRLARREQLLRARTRSKNEIQAVLQRRLQSKPPLADRGFDQSPAGGLSRSGPEGPPIRRGAGTLGSDLKARVGVRALGAGRGGLERGQATRPAACVL
jgi:transposase